MEIAAPLVDAVSPPLKLRVRHRRPNRPQPRGHRRPTTRATRQLHQLARGERHVVDFGPVAGWPGPVDRACPPGFGLSGDRHQSPPSGFSSSGEIGRARHVGPPTTSLNTHQAVKGADTVRYMQLAAQIILGVIGCGVCLAIVWAAIATAKDWAPKVAAWLLVAGIAEVVKSNETSQAF